MSLIKADFDSNFYSRQIGVYGAETMTKIIKLNIFIYGMRGLGVEIAKNIILSGPRSVTIYDPNITKINDLGSNFFLTKQDIENNRRRDESVFKKLASLNNYVKVTMMEDNNIIEHLHKNSQDKDSKYDVVLISEFMPEDEIININLICRNKNIGFIYTVEFGIYGFCFVDFGDNFYVNDESGNEPLSYCIKSISKAKKGIVTIDTTAGKLKLGNKDKVTFNEIQGMNELNGCEPMNIKVISRNMVEICDTSNFSDYISGGVMKEVKCQKEYHFKSLKEMLDMPFTLEKAINQIDLSKTNRTKFIHIGLLALNKFYKKNNQLPELNNEENSKELIKIGKEIYENKLKEKVSWLNENEETSEEEEEEDIENENLEEIFEKILLRISLWARSEISPIASFLGGISAQEIVKYTGKYRPIYQWIWFDFSETVENLGKDTNRDLQNDRYDDQIAIYGNKIQKNLSNSNVFIIGSGALGCEYLKTFALMGISTNKENQVTITDNDNIEISNLNRQFLFNYNHVGQPKSLIASKVVKEMNQDFNCFSMKTKIGIENENIFDEEFWLNQNYIINAVDNIEARKYIQSQSLIYKKILIDSGTLGTMGKSQVIIPNKTIKYSEPQKEESEQEAIAMCTLRNFPTLIVHCIEWARDKFDGYFIKIIRNLMKFCKDREKFYSELEEANNIDFVISTLDNVIKYTKLILNKNYDDCLEIAFNEYIIQYNNNILQILIDNPPDSINEDGSKYWSSNKRMPIPLPFDSENELIIIFIKKYADILSKSLSIPIIEDLEYIKKKCKSFKIKEFIPSKRLISNKNRYLDDKDSETVEEKKLKKKKRREEIEARLKMKNELLNKIKEIANKINLPDYKEISNNFKIQEFEKDNDSNGHIEFLYAASNLRANNFRIKNCDIYKVKTISGKITPAIATTTAGIVGLVSLQLYTLNQIEDINFLRDCNFNLAFNNYMFMSPIQCEVIKEKKEGIKFIPEKFTIWDFIEILGPMTIREFKQYFKDKYNINLYMISSNNINIYDLNKGEEKIDNKIEVVYNEVSKIKLYDKKRFLILDISGNIDNFIAKTPKIKYIFKKFNI